MKKALTVIVALCAMVALSAKAADVKENWGTHCGKCHGQDGTGNVPMGKKLKVKDYTEAKVQAEMKNEAMAKTIKEGVKEGESTKMKAFGEILSDDEIKALVAHVRSFKK